MKLSLFFVSAIALMGGLAIGEPTTAAVGAFSLVLCIVLWQVEAGRARSHPVGGPDDVKHGRKPKLR